MNLHEILKDKKCTESIKCAIWAVCLTFGWLCALIYGLAWLSSVTVTAEDIYARRRMAERIETLQGQIQHYDALIESKKYDMNRFENHKHRFWTGKVK